jgi:hypothetical protein
MTSYVCAIPSGDAHLRFEAGITFEQHGDHSERGLVLLDRRLDLFVSQPADELVVRLVGDDAIEL